MAELSNNYIKADETLFYSVVAKKPVLTKKDLISYIIVNILFVGTLLLNSIIERDLGIFILAVIIQILLILGFKPLLYYQYNSALKYLNGNLIEIYSDKLKCIVSKLVRRGVVFRVATLNRQDVSKIIIYNSYIRINYGDNGFLKVPHTAELDNLEMKTIKRDLEELNFVVEISF
ncbi:MAG: hypothetical protein ACMXYB_02675 [Candidatus Woesearchaeota archaeon]